MTESPYVPLRDAAAIALPRVVCLCRHEPLEYVEKVCPPRVAKASSLMGGAGREC